MELAHRWSDRNLTRMELVIALLILALLIGFFSRYVLLVFGQAEQTMLSRTIININTALNYRASMAVMRGQYDEIQLLLKMNPMVDMQASPELNHFANGINNISLTLAGSSISTPSNYGGIIVTDNPDTMEKGKWYFQQDGHVLIYRVSNSEFFTSDLEGPARIRFRIKIEYRDNNANGRYDLNSDEYHSVKLQSINKYTWNI